ncbi:MAG: hypothetical protein COV91_05590 [Candidatus Taylorbacteria bacterium CG11_big_fil_rev_8_21_14_0_20_46_11]|uniref:Uncharacterized protein n=1 Tax=Candidatus Taylorbacteria bacterium CG11_big_fil_rev_8_21_14_0_20_46_11 TaxID=1975025 RepID=A0A2H0KA90_9BACT|nr:MAG: hypothetical protein COV91_05590 [Candidatus Taylorbacteria bacterium CG11_big_fil_rev_8_21_14_0_20_46_11]
MTVKVIRKPNGEIEIILANGHAAALEKVRNDYRIKDDDKTVGFMLSVMREGGGSPIETQNGSYVPTREIVQDAPPLTEPLKQDVNATNGTPKTI